MLQYLQYNWRNVLANYQWRSCDYSI